MYKIKAAKPPRRRGKRFLLPCLMLLLLGLLVLTDQAIAPTLNALARQSTHLQIVNALESGVQEAMRAHPDYTDYQELIYVERNEDGQVTLLVPNTMRLNALVAEIVLQAEARVSDLQNEHFAIPLGAATGSKLLASLGPQISVDIWPISTVEAQISDDFVSQGLNQTRHRIWLELSADYSISVPFDAEKTTVTTQVLLTEGIIVGPLPQTYFDFSL